MENKLVCTWANGETLPESYIFPPERRPGEHAIMTSQSIPVIDLGKAERSERAETVQQIIEAAEDYGFFQVINHGVPRRLMDETRSVIKEFFKLPAEEKVKLYSVDQSKKFMHYTSSLDYDKEPFHYWRDLTRVYCAPLEECREYMPLEPHNYREVVGDYVMNVKELGLRILNLVCQGLGLEPTYFEGELSQVPVMIVNHYPPCPDPSLTLGTAKHCDPNLITILLQDDVPGLQVLKDGNWICVEPVSDGFVVNVGHLLQIVSNGKLRSVEHRGVTNKTKARTSAAFFLGPWVDYLVQPAKEVLSPENPPNYKPIPYGELVKSVRATFIGENDCAVQAYIVKS